jgi:hypothetical protein
VLTEVTPELVEASRRYRFRYGCESCAHHDAVLGECSNGNPNAAHRERGLEAGQTLVFCKLFELG